MKKIRNYMIAFLFMLIGVFMMENKFALAEETSNEESSDTEIIEEPNLDSEDAYIVINPNSNGEASFKYDEVQYTRSRDITVNIKMDEEELASYESLFDVCEVIPANTANNTAEIENCSFFLTSDEDNIFQLTGRKDGEKKLNIYFYTKEEGTNNYGNDAKISKTVVKKVVLDTTGPVITITGGEYLYIPYGQAYKENGATCVDDSGVTQGSCVVTVGEANIDMSKDGYQYVRYTATDFLGNEVNAVRKILVETAAKESNNVVFWIGAGIGVALLAAFLFIHVWKNKEKQKNESIL